MQIQEEKKGAVTVLRPAGPLTQQDAEQFKSRLLAVRDRSMGRFVVDVAGVPYVDSRGLEVLAEAHDELVKSGQSLKLCAVNETLREVLDLTEMASLFEQYEDAHSAVRSFL
ncbi:STAS domain-containing protein [Phycisphaerales bacterium AB-hyl4]|uniref:Anti-sigma factor antagonist n=1 Tax=Natronomicrosphaera hydrolytica TaxID=3242702 RepID=A0ABV4U248_9BACT